MTLAGAELLGDKWAGAPDRISPAGLAARVTTGALAGAIAAPRGEKGAAALVGAAAAVAAGYISFALRKRAMPRFGRMSSGVTEDAIALTLALCASGAYRGSHMSPSFGPSRN